MACVGPAMERENKFNAALGKTIRYRIRSNTLVLLDEKTALAWLESQAGEPQNSNP